MSLVWRSSDEPQVRHFKNDYGHVVERRCSKCEKVLAAYLKEEGGFGGDAHLLGSLDGNSPLKGSQDSACRKKITS